MSRLTNSAEGGTDGVAVSVVNGGGASGDAPTQVNNGTGSTIVYSDVWAGHGLLSWLVTPASAQVAQLIFGFTSTGVAQVGVAFRMAALPSVSTNILSLRSATGPAAILQMKSTGRIEVQSAVGGFLAGNVAGSALAVDTDYWLQLRAIPGASDVTGTIEASLSLLATPETSFWDTAGALTAVNAGTAELTNARLGRVNGAADTTATRWDSLVILTGADATGLPATWDLAKIPGTIGLVGLDDVEIGWTHPLDAPYGISIFRAASNETNDGDGDPPSDPDYDPTDLAGVTEIISGLDELDSPYTDADRPSGDHTYWLRRTAPP